MFEKGNILHYGVKRKSGRYPWGSGDDPYQKNGSARFLAEVDSLRAKGFRDTDIAVKLGMNTTQLRNNITWANNDIKEYRDKQIFLLKESGLTNTAIGNKVGASEATVRNVLANKDSVKKVQLDNVTDALKAGVDKTGYLDVGVGVERQLGISRTKFNAAVNKLVAEEGYHIHDVHVKRLSDPTGTKYTTVKTLTKDADVTNTRKNSDKIKHLESQSDDMGLTINPIGPPKMMTLDRVKVRYDEEGGTHKDGLIEMRPGAEGLDLGNSRYAQVRIGAGDNLYMKGMAVYSDEKFPNGIDVIYNTNKSLGTPKEKVLKTMKDDMDNPFGANIVKQKGHLNIVNEQGDWDTWSTKMSSQFLSKQPLSLIKDRLDATYSSLKSEYDEINSMTNPVVKKHLMEKFNEGLDSKAKHLKAQGLKDTKSHVLLPIPELNANEIYAPNYPNGSRVVLVRHPHGGKFEIPDLVVNNKSEKARKIMGIAPDAVGIHPSVAQKLSGADFDGDTVLVIPNNKGKIKTDRSLKELKNFDPMSYKVDHDTISPRTKQIQMGIVSNLITDMTIKGANNSELARAVKHSMVVIDAEKHKLDYKQSARDNGIAALRKKYQDHINPDTGKESRGASTLISRSKKLVDNLKKNKLDITDPSYDPHKYSSGRAQEKLYADYINGLKGLKNESSKTLKTIPDPPYSKEAAKKYAAEVQSLNKKLNVALLNAPRERQAQLKTNNDYYKHVKPDMDKDDKKKLKSRSLAKARIETGAKKTLIGSKQMPLTNKEWEAIQARAISTTKLKDILKNADMDVVRKLATPRETKVSNTKLSRARSLLAKGYTYAEVAETVGISTTVLREELGERKS